MPIDTSSEPIAVEDIELRKHCAQEILTTIPHLRRVIARDREGAGFPITIQQYLVLKALQERPYLISELAEKFKVSRPTMSRIIDGLEARRRNAEEVEEVVPPVQTNKRGKLVKRKDSADDRRLVYAHITEEGLEMIRKYHGKAEESVLNVLQCIPPEEIASLERSLAILRRALEEKTSN